MAFACMKSRSRIRASLPVCQKRKKVSSRLFVCRYGYEEHRDVHGARNILSKALHGTFVHWNVQTKLTYLRIA
uniref:zinc ribbon domain-containing protein n=1 Tax=Parageobacillus toebii TaxID=153151 RepID=UPI0035B5589F